ncbi:MAG TPA: phosphoadenosine phosphosulfate reductase family protein [Acetobacteraceae bacterium]|jgi:3'-phosphoadenosine 5'-phosphosulfate sulfotransferase (PAPS reductase)/FAD synthetase|nr:phosphoadenosine phosphosulfate reductase family protein [Acetobacteraceae bacterium]
MTTPDLRTYDWILINTSAGKDSLAMLDYLVTLADEAGVNRERLVVVHADLGRVEWSGTRELAERQAKRYGLRFEVVRREQNDLLDHVAARGKWPGYSTRYCTSDHKTKPVTGLMTQLVNETVERLALTRGRSVAARPYRRVRILNCLGLRAQESTKRRDMEPVSDDPATNLTRREVTRWLPIHGWSESEVWLHIKSRGLEYHRAYDLGMPRLSCVFCFYAPPEALLLAGYHNRELLGEYVKVERAIGHDFKQHLPLVQIERTLAAGYVPAGPVDGAAWSECA